MKRLSLGKFFLLLIAFLIYSSSTILSKYASQYDFVSLPYILYFGGVLLALGIYAVLWQKILSFMQLNKAFLCKSITIIFILVFSYFFFEETITVNNIVGILIIITGLLILAWEN